MRLLLIYCLFRYPEYLIHIGATSTKAFRMNSKTDMALSGSSQQLWFVPHDFIWPMHMNLAQDRGFLHQSQRDLAGERIPIK